MREVLDIPWLLHMMEENPEWQAALRRAVLSEDLLELPELVYRLSEKVEALAEAQRQTDEAIRALAESQRKTDEAIRALAEAQKRTEARLDELAEAQRRTDEAVRALAEAQQRTEERLQKLEETVWALAEAQKRTEARLDELAEAQRRTDEAVRALAEAQKRTEARLDELAEAQRRTDEAVRALAEAQKRTEARLDELAEAQKRTEARVDHLAAEVSNLSRTVGATVESEAEDWILYLLEERGYQILGEPVQVRMDGEVDVAIPAAKDGQILWAVAEAKTRLSRREIVDWANRMRSEGFRRRLARYGVPGPYMVYIYALRLDAKCDETARKFGVGLITDRGERVPPGPLLPPAGQTERA